jgi:hypothetical protein
MNIQTEKIAIAKMILDIDDPAILESIKNLLKKEAETDFWNTLSIKEKEDIEKGITEIENCDTVEYVEYMRKHR